MDSSRENSEFSLLNEEKLLRRWEGNRELIGDILSDCLENCSSRLEALKDAIERRDARETHFQSSHLKDLALNAASPMLEILAMEMDLAAVKSDWGKAESLLRRLKAFLDSLWDRLKRAGWLREGSVENDVSIRVGVSSVDGQHREIFATLRELQRCGSGETERALAIMHTLIALVHVHYETEEGVMESSSYPGFDFHRQEHNVFIAHLRALRSELGREGSLTGAELGAILEVWQRDHISKMDRAYARHKGA